MPESVVYQAVGEVVVVLDEDAAVLTATWQGWANHETVRDCLNAQADAVDAGLADYAVVDIQAATGAASAMDRDYIHRFVFPRFRTAGLRGILVVRPRSAHTRRGTSSWTHNGRMWRFPMFEVDSLAEAHRVIRADRARRGGLPPDAASPAVDG